MALSGGRADVLAAAICSALGVTDTASKNKYKQVYELIYSALLTDIVITITANAIPVITNGSATTQSGTGPTAPVNLSPN